jgi:probable F420-dependent oxidoreductase
MRVSWREKLGPVGVWRGVNDTDTPMAAAIEDAGFGTIWLGGSPPADLTAAEELLAATRSIVIATGIVNIWRTDPGELADSYHRISARFPGRLLLGIGSGHREATPERVRPLDAMARYLDTLDEREVPVQARVLSALGPRMLALAAGRSAGTHPYLTVPAQTRQMREDLGADVLIAPEQTVILDTDAAQARRAARGFLRNYLTLVNYTSTMQRGGFSAEDVAGEGSDHLVDTLIVHGDAQTLADGVRAHLSAGADHVCVQVQPVPSDVIAALRAIATELRPPARR